MTVNLHILLKFYPAGYSCKLQVIPTVQRFAVSRSNDVCLFICRDTLMWTTAEIICLINIRRKFFHREEVWWCLSQQIGGILHEAHTNYEVMMYG